MNRLAKIFNRWLPKESGAEARMIAPEERAGIMRKHIATGAMGTMYGQLTLGMYLFAFGGNIGMQPWHWGVLTALSLVILVLQLVSAYMVGRVGNRKRLWFVPALAGRLLRGVAIVGAYALAAKYTGSMARGLFITLLVLANCLDAMSVPPWFSWLADIIPGEQHGRFMGRRSAWIALATVCVVLPVGWVMDQVKGSEGAGGSEALLVVFGLGLVLGMMDLFIHRTIPEPPMDGSGGGKEFWVELMEPLRNRGYRAWLLFGGVWNFGLYLGAALCWMYFVENLGIRNNFFGGTVVLIALPLLASVIGGWWLGRMVDRYGVKRTLRWGSWGWGILPLFWCVATPATAMWWLGVGSLVGNLGVEAANNAGTKLVTRFRPAREVPMYFAVSTCVGALAGAAGALTAGLLVQGLKPYSWVVWGFALTGFHLVFVMSAVLRVGSTVLIERIEIPGSGKSKGDETFGTMNRPM